MTPERLKELTDLVNSKNYYDRKKAAQQLDLPVELQEVLSKDVDKGGRYHLATNPNITPEIMEVLSKDEDSCVRYWLTLNPNITPEIMDRLSRDEDSWVRSKALERIEEIKDKIKLEFKNKILEVGND